MAASHVLRLPVERPSLARFLMPALLASYVGSVSWPMSWWQSLHDLLPPFVFAVPKKKTSHSKKAMRSANKGLKDKNNIVHCPGCGSPKLAHHLCPTCYTFLSRRWKMQARQEAAGGGTVSDS